MRECDAVLANLTPFRGPSADVGTIFELGYARGLGKPVFGYSNELRPYCERCGSLTPEGMDADGLHVELFGCVDNLMIHGALASSGDGRGAEVAEAPPPVPGAAARLAELSAFRAAASRVAEYLAQRPPTHVAAAPSVADRLAEPVAAPVAEPAAAASKFSRLELLAALLGGQPIRLAASILATALLSFMLLPEPRVPPPALTAEACAALLAEAAGRGGQSDSGSWSSWFL